MDCMWTAVKFLRFSNKASLFSKEGFFSMQTRLLYIAKKPCLKTGHLSLENHLHEAWRKTNFFS